MFKFLLHFFQSFYEVQLILFFLFLLVVLSIDVVAPVVFHLLLLVVVAQLMHRFADDVFDVGEVEDSLLQFASVCLCCIC